MTTSFQLNDTLITALSQRLDNQTVTSALFADVLKMPKFGAVNKLYKSRLS